MEPGKRKPPPLPPIGEPEQFYVKMVRNADHERDALARDAFKVGQYITLGLNPTFPWEEKLRYFRHALERHCKPPPFPDDDVWLFYRELANLVRIHAGRDALKIASHHDDIYAQHAARGTPRAQIEAHAEALFVKLIPADRPDWFKEEDYNWLKLIRDQWL